MAAKEKEMLLSQLYAIIAWYKAHPNAPVIYLGNKFLKTFDAKPETIKAIGPGKKVFDDSYFNYVVDIAPGIQIEFFTSRGAVCQKKVIGTRTVPEEVIPTIVGKVIPAHEEEITEWECPESLLK